MNKKEEIEKIKKRLLILNKEIEEKTKSFASSSRRNTERVARSAIRGALSVPDLPIHLKNMVSKSKTPTFSSYTDKMFDSEYLKPQTKGEHIFDAVVEGVAGMGPSGLIGKGLIMASKTPYVGKMLGGVGKLLKSGTKLTSSNLASQALFSGAVENAIQEKRGVLSGMGEGLIANAALSSLGALKRDGRAKAASRLFSVDSNRSADFDAAGLKKTIGDVSTSPMVRKTQNVLIDRPFVDRPFEEIYKYNQKHIKDTILSKKPLTDMSLGSLAIEAAQSARDKNRALMQNQMSEIISDLKGSSGKNSLDVSVDSLKNDLLGEFKSLNHELYFNDWIKTPRGKLYALLSRLTKKSKKSKSKSSGANDTKGEVPPHTISFDLLSKLKTQLSDEAYASRVPGSPTNSYNRELSMNSRDVSSLMDNYIDSMGGDIAKKYSYFKKMYTDYSKYKKPYIKNILDKNNHKNSKIADDLYRDLQVGGGAARLVLGELPPDQKKSVLNTLFYKMGQHSSGFDSDNFSFYNFSKNLNKLEPEVKEILQYSNWPEQSIKNLDHVMKSISHIRETGSERNFSKTETHRGIGSFFKDGLSLVPIAAGVGAGSGAGVLAGLSAFILPYLTSFGVTKGLFTNQKFIDLAAYGSRLNSLAEFPDWLEKLKNFKAADKVIPKFFIKRIEEMYKKAIKERNKETALKRGSSKIIKAGVTQRNENE